MKHESPPGSEARRPGRLGKERPERARLSPQSCTNQSVGIPCNGGLQRQVIGLDIRCYCRLPFLLSMTPTTLASQCFLLLGFNYEVRRGAPVGCILLTIE